MNILISYKYHTVNMHVILADEESEFHCVNYNNLTNKDNNCYDKYIEYSSYGFNLFRNTHNCKYFIQKCYNKFYDMNNRDTNNITEYRIIDNVFNVNMLRLYWKYAWLPEEYIFGYTAEDYVCEVQDFEEYYKNKLLGSKVDLDNWNKIQDKLINCNKTFDSTSSLFIEYTKNYPNFLIDDDTKYKTGEHPKRRKDIISSTSVSTIHSSASEGTFIKELQKRKRDKVINKHNFF